MSDYRDINSLNTTPTALITGGDKVPFYNTGDAYAYAMTLDQLQSWVLSGGTIDPTFDDVTCDTLVTTGNVGIGTASPAVRLHVKGTADTGSVLRLEPATSTTVYSQVRGNNGDLVLDADPGNAEGSTSIKFHVDNTERMRIDASGNVGIGTTSPSTFVQGFFASANGLAIGGANSPCLALVDTTDSNNYRSWVAQLDTTMYVWNGANGNLLLGTNGTQRWQVSAAGHFLAGADASYDIGASGANRPRDIYMSRDLRVGGGLTVTSGPTSLTEGAWLAFGANNTLFSDTTNGTILQAAPTADRIVFRSSNTTERMRVKSGGQVRFVPLAAAPTTNVEDGDVYYDSGTNKLRVRAGGAWVDLH